ncbi:NADP-dependent oxidoreductase domain-containing protein [Panaeolus papilionaceus]|nr:NADP-dependent oxidoreductase domain-containing protein [Panaeolus papilionaceus]
MAIAKISSENGLNERASGTKSCLLQSSVLLSKDPMERWNMCARAARSALRGLVSTLSTSIIFMCNCLCDGRAREVGTCTAMAAPTYTLHREGNVRYIGLSEVSAATLRRAHAMHLVAAVQVEYSPFFLEIEDSKIGLLKACWELGVIVVAYSPLGRGMLTGNYTFLQTTGEKEFHGKFNNDNFPQILRLVEDSEFQEIGKKHNATAGQSNPCVAFYSRKR